MVGISWYFSISLKRSQGIRYTYLLHHIISQHDPCEKNWVSNKTQSSSIEFQWRRWVPVSFPSTSSRPFPSASWACGPVGLSAETRGFRWEIWEIPARNGGFNMFEWGSHRSKWEIYGDLIAMMFEYREYIYIITYIYTHIIRSNTVCTVIYPYESR